MNMIYWPKLSLKKLRLSGISVSLAKSLFEICVVIKASNETDLMKLQ